MGAPTASVELPLEFSYLEIGDVVTLEDAPIAWEGYDQYAQFSWEITSVEYNPLSDTPSVKLTLCLATHAKPAPFTDFTMFTLPGMDYVTPGSGGGVPPYRAKPPNPFGFDSHMRQNAGILGGCGPLIDPVSNKDYPRELFIRPGTVSNGSIGVPVKGRG